MGKLVTEMLKGTLEGIVLAILSARPAYGYEITARLRDQGFIDIAEGTIYALLVRVEQRDLVDVEKVPSEKKGRRARCTPSTTRGGSTSKSSTGPGAFWPRGSNSSAKGASRRGRRIEKNRYLQYLQLVTGPLEEKKRWWQYKARIKHLPDNYRTAVEALERYLMHFGPADGAGAMAMYEDLADLFEQSAADRTPPSATSSATTPWSSSRHSWPTTPPRPIPHPRAQPLHQRHRPRRRTRQDTVMTTQQPPAIQVHGLEKSYKDLQVLRGVNFEVARGSIFALLGSNGAGKTTAVKILSTLLKLDAGTARINGFDVATQAADVRESISLTGQFAAVDEILSGRENLVLVARLRHLRNPGKIADDLLARFSLTDAGGRKVATYSGGMRRRLDIAMSLIGNPPVVFLDEPTTGLDPQARIEVWQAVRKLAQGGTTVLLTTQYLDEAEQLADRIAILHEGRILVNGTLDELKRLLPPAEVEYVEKQPTLEDVFLSLVGTKA
ncbi:ATP-binding cassette domain-containing protein [Nonomuraea salmonea]